MPHSNSQQVVFHSKTSYLFRDDPDVTKIASLLAESGFFPNLEELELIKGWIIFNMQDILTFHLQPLAQFRAFIRYISVHQSTWLT